MRRHSRLTQSADFGEVFSGGRRSADRYFTVLYRSCEHAGSRLGMAIAKKNIARAVARNRIKRIIRESFRHHQHSLPPMDIVVMARHGAGSADSARLRKSLKQHWQRLAAKPDAG